MAEKISKKDFVEIDFIGKIKDTGEIFDTNIKEESKKLSQQAEVKPLLISVGHDMLVKGFDKALEGKEIGKKYNISLTPEEAFGKRKSELVRLIPLRVFREKNFNPIPGMVLNLDNMLVKILTVSGGRVTADFNNPLAGKEIEYEFTIKRKITDEKEKIDSLQDFLFRQKFSFEIKDKKIIFSEEAAPFLQIFGQKFKEILGKETEVKAKDKKTEDKEEENKKSEDKEAKEEEKKKTKGKEVKNKNLSNTKHIKQK